VDTTLPVHTTDVVGASSRPVGYHALGDATSIEGEGSHIRVRVETSIVEVTALTETIFRVGFFPHGRPVDYHSAAVVSEDQTTDAVSAVVSDDEITVTTKMATAHIALHPLRIGFADHAGRIFAADDPMLGMGCLTSSPQSADIDVPNAGEITGVPVRVYKKHLAGEHYFGCGERIGSLDKTETHQLFWNIDPPPGRTALQNNLYVSIPFTLVLDAGQAWGIFLDSTTLTEFDLAKSDPETSWFGATCGDLVYYIFCGPTPQDVLAQYTKLTGRTPLPPLWGLGNGQSRFSYETADEVLRLAHTFRERDIPCDTIYLDIDYMQGFRNFTWDSTRFPDPAALLTELHAMGFHVVNIVDAGVKVDENYPVYTEGRDRQFFCKDVKGNEYQNTVWPGVSVFPDFYYDKARTWWGEQHRPLLDVGVSGIWCDMNEPALFTPSNSTMPANVMHMDDGKVRLHLQVHNAYGSLMAKSTREGLLQLRADQRPFVITRSGYAGVQRYGIVWTGDNLSTWDNLAMSIAQLLNLGLSGVGWSGVDIGGFYEDTNGELLARWVEFGIFQAFCRNHAEKLTRRQEPWVFGESYETICRTMLKLRMRLIPYLYTLFDESHRTGAPLLRPLFWAYPEDISTYAIDDEFLCGNTLLVAPITRPGIEHRHVYIPEGTWFHYWTGTRIEGPAHILVHAPLGQPAFYVRANTVLPLYPDMNYVGERAGDPLTLVLYPACGHGEAVLYEDAGNGYAQEHGEYARRTFTCDVHEGHIRLSISQPEGTFVSPYQRLSLEIHEVVLEPTSVTLDGAAVPWRFDAALRLVSIEMDVSSSTQIIEIAISQP
jgi:alpha-glucosidase